MRRWLEMGLVFSLGCSAAARPDLPVTSPVATPSATPPPLPGAEATVPPSAGALSKAYTGGARPALLIRNSFPVAQHVFIDWEPRGRLAPGASQIFELSPGAHTITCADSPNVDDNPSTITEVLEAGFSYEYRISRSR